MAGGTTIGYASEIFGRRICIIVMCVLGGALTYPYGFTSSKSVMAAAFFEQFCVQGAFGVIPIYLTELAPGSIRSFAVGTSYQLGNLASSASSTIESTIGERFPLAPLKEGKKTVQRYDYGKVICIFVGCAFAYNAILTFFGPERKGIELDVAHDWDMVEATGTKDITKLDRIVHGGDSFEDEEAGEKRTAAHRELV